MKKTVEQLLKSDVSAYKISKGAEVPYMTVNDLRNGKSSIENAKYGTIAVSYTHL